jgi:hypothetical protein
MNETTSRLRSWQKDVTCAIEAAMDWDIESTSIIILGAGFSAAVTDGKLPLMTGYFDKLQRSDFPDLYDFVLEVGCNRKCERVEFANVERVLLAVDQIRTSPDGVLKDFLDWKPRLAVVQSQMSYYTLSRLRDGLTISPSNWAARLLAGSGFGTTIISMNYDNIAEQILSRRPGATHGDYSPTCPHCKMRLMLARACNCSLRHDDLGDSWRGSLIKPHGSISWCRCRNSACCSYDCLIADQHCRPFDDCKCPNCGAGCEPVLVMPTMSKNLNDFPEIDTMWQAARLAIREAESLLLFGFSVPTSDELLVQLVRSACGDGRRLKQVASIDLEPEAVLDRFQSCLPAGFDVDIAAFPVEKGTVPIWLDLSAPKVYLRS